MATARTGSRRVRAWLAWVLAADITRSSEPGHGTTARMYFPKAQE